MPAEIKSPRYDTIARRFGAFAIDYFLLNTVAGFVLGAVAFLIAFVTEGPPYRFLIFCSFLTPAYFIVADVRFGGTVGKRLTGLRVVTVSGAPITVAIALRRYSWMIVLVSLAAAAPTVFRQLEDELLIVAAVVLLIAPLIWIGADIDHCFRSPWRRALHDTHAGTVVEIVQSKTAQPGATDNPDDAQRLREDH